MERSDVLPTTQFAYRKGLSICDALLCVSHTLQSALESGQESRIVQIDFSAAFDRVNHQGILYTLCSGWYWRCCVVYIDVVSIKPITVMVDGCQSKLVSIVSGVPQCCVFVMLLLLLYTSELFSILDNKLIGYAACYCVILRRSYSS